MAQHAPQQSWPSGGYERPSRMTPGGAPLGRIVAGVFLGLLAWTAVMALVAYLVMGYVVNSFEKAYNDTGADTSSTTSSGLSQECQDAIDANDDISTPCLTDDQAKVGAYIHSQAGK
jgi:hypothetical protein